VSSGAGWYWSRNGAFACVVGAAAGAVLAVWVDAVAVSVVAVSPVPREEAVSAGAGVEGTAGAAVSTRRGWAGAAGL
ncbi:MAG TPA: hypothetical protein VHH32_02465, partial [Gemmatimonadales bacterium]|nr:hypothetical protein [Gemmatimonadales bacterium]